MVNTGRVSRKKVGGGKGGKKIGQGKKRKGLNKGKGAKGKGEFVSARERAMMRPAVRRLDEACGRRTLTRFLLGVRLPIGPPGSRQPDKPKSKADLDADLDSYMMRDKKAGTAKLNDDLDEYMAAKAKGTAEKADS